MRQIPPVLHYPRLAIEEREVLDHAIAVLIFGAPPLDEPTTTRMALDKDGPCCPWTGERLVKAQVSGDDVLWACPRPVVQLSCSYEAVWKGASGEFAPPRIFGSPWVPPIGPLRYPPMTVTEARKMFGEPKRCTLRVPKPPPSMRLTGHKTEAVYRRYAIASKADLADGVRKLAALVAADQDQTQAHVVVPLTPTVPGRSQAAGK